MRFFKMSIPLTGIVALLFVLETDAYETKEDIFMKGYTTAVLERLFDLPDVGVTVERGVVILEGVPRDENQRDRIVKTLSELEYVESIEFKVKDEPGVQKTFEEEMDQVFEGFFPKDDLFEPLLADPWESRFFLSYRIDEDVDRDLGAVGLGEVFGLYRWTDVFGPGHHIQLNVEGAVFGYFDMDSDSTDLLNIDFQVGFPVVYKYDLFTSRFRIMHRSSHIGDDYLYRDPPRVWNIPNYQVDDNFVDWFFSYGPPWLRVYAGGTYKFDVSPSRAPWEIDYGIEYKPWHERAIHPVFGIHIKHQEEFGWAANQRFLGGVEIQDWPFRNRVTRILGEYYNGKSLQWSFYRDDGEYYGLGVYFEF